MSNKFRSEAQRAAYTNAVRYYHYRLPPLYVGARGSRTPNIEDELPKAFWAGFHHDEVVNRRYNHSRIQRQTEAYAYFRAGEDCSTWGRAE